ncbi:MAG: hypothetical protein Q8L86_13660 [Vicinamibacterales bacterium]|nr:hypothetical protein [Vicinamibacterales bacterium]
MRPGVATEAMLAAAIAAAFSVWSLVIQSPASVIVWDAVQYLMMAGQLAAGQVVAAEAPYVYRLGTPWLVAQFWPDDPMRGYFLINTVCACAIAVALTVWLRQGVERMAVRLGLVALYAAAWHGPIRYTHYNPAYVDPLFLLLVLAGLAVASTLRDEATPAKIALLTLLTIAGTLVRETMLLVPVAALFVRNPLPLPGVDADGGPRAFPVAVLIPIVAGVAALTFTFAVVEADTTRNYFAAAAQWIRKPPTSYLLAWFTAYGPVVAVLVFDWRAVARDLATRQHLLAYLGMCTVLAYFGGSDTERFHFWAMPVVYLLLGRAVERRWPVLRGTMIAGGLVVVQAVASRVFWAIPDTNLEGPALGDAPGIVARLYGVVDRLLVIEHFHWNLWSSFGSQPFKLLRLGMYVGVTACFVWAMSRRARTVAA